MLRLVKLNLGTSRDIYLHKATTPDSKGETHYLSDSVLCPDPVVIIGRWLGAWRRYGTYWDQGRRG
jgi:hypothetical protein